MGILQATARLVGRTAGGVRASYEEAKWQRLRLDSPAGWAALFGRESKAGKIVNLESALQVSTVWACVRLTAQAIASLPIGVYERAPANSREDAADTTFARTLRDSPNADQTGLEYWESMVAWAAATGNAYSEIVTLGNQLSSLGRPWASGLVTPARTPAGDLVYRIVDRGKVETLPRDKVFHLRWFDFGGDAGLSPIAYGANAVGAAMAADESAAKLFANGIQAAGVLTAEHDLNAAQREQLSKILETYVSSERANKLMVLEAGLKFEKLTLNPEDAQLLETRRFNVEEICRWFGVPPIIVGHAAQGQTMWGSGVEQILLAWLALGINPLCRRIEARARKQLVPAVGPERRLYMEFNREGLLQMDSKAKAAFLSTVVQNGLMDRNEARAKLNLPRRDGADQLTAQTNLAPLDALGANGDGAQLRQALRTFLEVDEGGRRDERNQP